MATPGKLGSPDLQKRIADQYIDGVGVTAIARAVGVSYSSVRDLLLRKGLLRHLADFPLKRFEASFVVTPGCWLWVRQLYPSGYGCFSTKNRRYRAHRYSYETYKGAIPPRMHVLHSCDNPRCVNPDHLRIGTDFDNTQDKIARNRFNLKRRAGVRL